MMEVPRFASDAAGLVAAEAVHFPLAVAARQPTCEAAVRLARQALDGLRQQLAGLGVGTVEVAHQLRCPPEGRGAARVEVTAALVLRWAAEAGGFWERADGVARALDLLARPPGSADVSVTVGPVNHRPEVGGKGG